MKKSLWFLLGLTGFVMLGIPWLAVTFAPGDAGMAICFLLFFGLNPLYALLVGIWSGMDAKRRWFWPFVCAFLFLLGTWLLFDPRETAFLVYCGAYLLVGLAAMVLGRFLRKFIQ